MTTRFRRLGRAAYAVVALALAATIVVPSLTNLAEAAQVTSRYIKMQVSTPNATGVDYEVGFTASAAAGNTAVKGVVVDFCDEDPLIGDGCTAPTAFTMTGGSVATTGAPNTGLGAGWTAAFPNSGRTLTLTNATGVNIQSTAVVFTISGVHNPSSTNHTFYARILTYANDSGANSPATYVAGTEGTYIDYGGVAMSTATDINILARVMEQITFCTSDADMSATNCGSASGTVDLTIGHVVGGGSTQAIDSSQLDSANAFTQLSTNANGGAVVRMKNTYSTACGGLSRDNGTTCEIPAIGASPALFTLGTADFGMCVDAIDAGDITPASPYDGSAPGTVACDSSTTTPDETTQSYGMGDTTATAQYGDVIYDTGGNPVDKADAGLSFAAAAALTTPAGIYQTSESLVATGTF